MKTIISSGLSVMIAVSSIWAQDGFSPILEEIQKNNTTLQAMQKHSEAEKLSSQTGIFLQNPEVGFNYLWGNPNAIGNRTDFSVLRLPFCI